MMLGKSTFSQNPELREICRFWLSASILRRFFG